MGSARSHRHEANRRQLAEDIIYSLMIKAREIPTMDLDEDAETRQLAADFIADYLRSKFNDDGVWSDLIEHANMALHKDRDSTRAPSGETRQMVLDLLSIEGSKVTKLHDDGSDPFAGLSLNETHAGGF